MKEQELLIRLLAQQPVFDAVLVVGEFHLFDTGQRQRLKVIAQFLLSIVPEDDPSRSPGGLTQTCDNDCSTDEEQIRGAIKTLYRNLKTSAETSQM